MKSLARFAMVFLASAVGCVSGSAEDEREELAEEKTASAKQGLGGSGGYGNVWGNGGDAWGNGGDAWGNGGDAWGNGGHAFSNDINGWTGERYDDVTDGWADAFSGAWSASWSNGWNFTVDAYNDPAPLFAWTEPQSCAHPLSQTGTKLVSGCNSMVTLVCGADPFCCNSSWDAICVREATTWGARKGTSIDGTYIGCYTDSTTRALPEYLGVGMTIEQCIFEAQGLGFTHAGLEYGGECWAGNGISNGHTEVPEWECNMPCTADSTETCGGWWRNSVWQVPTIHPVTQEGGGLSSSHSACAAAVIAQLPTCTTSWTASCVEKAAQICVERYVTRPVYEDWGTTTYDPNDPDYDPKDDDRVMVDTCIETKIQGYPACPIPGSGPSAKECCRRALVLKGVYRKDLQSAAAGLGQQVLWSPSESVYTPLSPLSDDYPPIVLPRIIEATVVPQRCFQNFHGSTSCGKKHHLWQAAGIDDPLYGPLYPDCSGTSGPRPCNGTYEDQLRQVVNGLDRPYRGILLATLSALLTTDGEYNLDLRLREDTEALPWHANFDTGSFEAYWSWEENTSGGMVGRPACVFRYSDQRTWTNDALVENVGGCLAGEGRRDVWTFQALGPGYLSELYVTSLLDPEWW